MYFNIDDYGDSIITGEPCKSKYQNTVNSDMRKSDNEWLRRWKKHLNREPLKRGKITIEETNRRARERYHRNKQLNNAA